MNIDGCVEDNYVILLFNQLETSYANLAKGFFFIPNLSSCISSFSHGIINFDRFGDIATSNFSRYFTEFQNYRRAKKKQFPSQTELPQVINTVSFLSNV